MATPEKRKYKPTFKTLQQILLENTTDTLTGIGNRQYWKDSLEEMRQSTDPVAILIIDLNNFKQINDTFGHQKGDEILIRVAQILEKSLRPDDILARLGGDEFGIAFPVPPDQISTTPREVAERIEHNLEQSNQESSIKITLSIGEAVSKHPPSDLNTAISQADDKMYRNKQYKKREQYIDGAGI